MGGKCNERIRLIQVLLLAVRAHHDITAELRNVSGQRSENSASLSLVQGKAHDAGVSVEMAMEAYRHHITQHQCGTLEPVPRWADR